MLAQKYIWGLGGWPFTEIHTGQDVHERNEGVANWLVTLQHDSQKDQPCS